MTIQNEQGRTMLEMLGVIAIIGIITYGAIAGIGYGMQTYKVNQTYNDVQDIIQGVEDLYSWSRAGYPARITQAVVKNNIFSGDPVGNCEDGAAPNDCKLAGQFGNIWVQQGYFGDNNPSTFTVFLTITDEDIKDRLESLNWDTLNIVHDCGEQNAGSYTCMFSPK